MADECVDVFDEEIDRIPFAADANDLIQIKDRTVGMMFMRSLIEEESC